MYKQNDKMSDLICENYEALQVLSRFSIPLGFGEETVSEVCKKHNIDTKTFLAIVNFKKDDTTTHKAEDLSVTSLMQYLQQAHGYFLEFQFPVIRRKLIEAINYSVDNKVAFMILQFFDEFVSELRRHMEYENETVFAYINKLQNKTQNNTYTIDTFAEQHRAIDDSHVEKKLTELKNIIIKYYPMEQNNDLLNATLFDIFSAERELAKHCYIEDLLFVPAVQQLEKQNKISTTEETVEKEMLSEREKEIVVGVVKGFTNKEIADQLFLSIHTVITHRKNIAKKLQIHSPAGLTIYAIVNKLVDISEMDTNSLS